MTAVAPPERMFYTIFMSSRLRKAKPKPPQTGARALRHVRNLISKNRLTTARIQRMQLTELLTLATILKSAHDVSSDDKEKAAIRNVIAFVAQTAEAQYGDK